MSTEEWLIAHNVPARRPAFSQATARLLEPMEALFQRLYGSSYNPTFQSGVLAIFLMVLATASGGVLLIFYRVGAPYESMQTIQGQIWLGRWLRALHRYSSDAAMVAVVVHMLRMLVSGRTWGARALAWWTGLLLTGLMVAVGVSGLMMVWDTQAHRLSVDAVSFLEGLPIFSEPIGRMFADNSSVTQAFFFILMFLHVAMPLGLVALIWLHTLKVARARLWPEPHLAKLWGLALLALALVWPLPLAPKADLLSLPALTPLDWFYAFWVPPVESWGRGGSLAFFGLGTVLLTSVPFWCKPTPVRPPPSFVDERSCTGCTQCYKDCPYEAISMVARGRPVDPAAGKSPKEDRRSDLVARVDSDRCVSCGICAGSCAPMGVGPPMRTGRDQLRDIDDFLKGRTVAPGDVVVLACRWGCGESAAWSKEQGVHLLSTGCSGSVHTSVIEWLLRHGVDGVIVVSCPERNCSHREGGQWLRLRLYHDREAELQPRVDRRRLRHLEHPLNEVSQAMAAARQFRQLLLASPELLGGRKDG